MNYYHDMWEIHSHALTTLTKIFSIKVKFKWTKTKKIAFDEIKQIVACDNLLTYPDFTKEFKIYTDARDLQLGEVIIQKVKPIALYSIRLTETQRRYIVT